ncbi:hypothetical protein ACV229_39865 [Burkholderia sp. MR1-5-21]
MSLSLLVIVVALSHRVTLEARPDFRGAICIAFAGCLDASGTMLYKSALVYGQQLSIVATLVSLYPLTTVVLATTILREQWSRLPPMAFHEQTVLGQRLLTHWAATPNSSRPHA